MYKLRFQPVQYVLLLTNFTSSVVVQRLTVVKVLDRQLILIQVLAMYVCNKLFVIVQLENSAVIC